MGNGNHLFNHPIFRHVAGFGYPEEMKPGHKIARKQSCVPISRKNYRLIPLGRFA